MRPQNSEPLVPLTDMGGATYHGYRGGLYAAGRNVPPKRYLDLGLRHAARVEPRDPCGRPSPDGSIVLLSVGLSNTSMEFGAFQGIARRVDNPRLVTVDGALGGQDAVALADIDAAYWSHLSEAVENAGVTDDQVQAIWLKEAIAEPSLPFPDQAQRLQAHLAQIVETLEQRYAHLQLIYVSSRTYGGYANIPLNPEPYAYETGFSVKWLVADRIRAAYDGQDGPWLGWGPYLWTNGMQGRADGLVWTREDVAEDGTHPSVRGRLKVARLLLDFFSTDPTARSWFLPRPDGAS